MKETKSTCREISVDGPIIKLPSNTCLRPSEPKLDLSSNKITSTFCCRSKIFGCHYQTSNEFLLHRHEKWICKYPGNSYPKHTNKNFINKHICKHLIMNKSRIEHFLEVAHATFIGYNNVINNITTRKMDKDNVVITCLLSKSDEWNNFLFSAYDIPFISGVKFTNKRWIEIMVTAGTENAGSDRFDIKFKLRFPGINQVISGKLDIANFSIDINPDYYDWLIVFFPENSKVVGHTLPELLHCEICIIKKI